MQSTSRFLPVLLLLLAALCCFPSVLHAGSPGLYIITDKEQYTAGEWIRFQAFILYPAPTTNNSVFTGLLDCNGREIARKILPAENGSAWGNFELPGQAQGDCYLYCYITDNRNTIQSYLTRKITIGGNGQPAMKPATAHTLLLSLACEGNTFVAECPNSILLKSTDGNGNPIRSSGLLFDDRNVQLSRFETNADGYVRLLFSPEQGVGYYVTATGANGATLRKDLPPVAASGVSLKVSLTDSAIRCAVYSYTDSIAGPEYILTVVSRADTVHATAISFNTGLSAIIEDLSFSKLPRGFLTLAVSDKKGRVMASRVVYNGQPLNKGSFIRVMDTIARKEALVSLPAYVSGNACITINSAGQTASGKGLQAYEAYCIIDNTANRDAAFNDHLIACAVAPAYYAVRDNINRFLSLDGMLYYHDRKPAKNKSVNLVITQKDKSKNFLVASTDKTGRLKLDNLVFFDSATVYYQLADKSEEKNLVSLDLKITPVTQDVPQEWLAGEAGCTPVISNPGVNTDQKGQVIAGNKTPSTGLPGEKTLQGVTVTGEKPREKTLTEKFEEKNGPSQFSGQNFIRSQFNFLENPQLVDNTLLLDFIRGRMSGVSVTYAQGMPQITSSAGYQVSVFVDDVELDSLSFDLLRLYVSEVAIIKYNSLGVRPSLTGGGSLLIYTRKGFMTPEAPIKGMPYTSVKGYTLEKRLPASGNSSSLYWQMGYDPEKEPVVYVRLPEQYDQQPIRLVLEGVNNLMAPYRFTQELVFR